jgi:hypothetical protein
MQVFFHGSGALATFPTRRAGENEQIIRGVKPAFGKNGFFARIRELFESRRLFSGDQALGRARYDAIICEASGHFEAWAWPSRGTVRRR